MTYSHQLTMWKCIFYGEKKFNKALTLFFTSRNYFFTIWENEPAAASPKCPSQPTIASVQKAGPRALGDRSNSQNAGLPAKGLFRQGHLLINAELVVFENVLGTQGLVTAIGQAAGRVLEPIGVMAAGPKVEVAHMSTQTGLVHHRNILAIRVQGQLAVIGRDVGTVAVAIEQIAVRLAARPDA